MGAFAASTIWENWDLRLFSRLSKSRLGQSRFCHEKASLLFAVLILLDSRPSGTFAGEFQSLSLSNAL